MKSSTYTFLLSTPPMLNLSVFSTVSLHFCGFHNVSEGLHCRYCPFCSQCWTRYYFELTCNRLYVAFQPNPVGSYWSSVLKHRLLRIRAYICDVQLVTDSLWLPERSPTIKKGDETEHKNTACNKNQKKSLATREQIQKSQEYQSPDSTTIWRVGFQNYPTTS